MTAALCPSVNAEEPNERDLSLTAREGHGSEISRDLCSRIVPVWLAAVCVDEAYQDRGGRLPFRGERKDHLRNVRRLQDNGGRRARAALWRPPTGPAQVSTEVQPLWLQDSGNCSARAGMNVGERWRSAISSSRDSVDSMVEGRFDGGGGWIRTSVRLRGQIYSLLPLTTRPPLQELPCDAVSKTATCTCGQARHMASRRIGVNEATLFDRRSDRRGGDPEA